MSGGVPPSGRQPSSTPAGRRRPDEDKKAKEFRMPDKKGQKTEGKEEEKKKKGVFDLAGEGVEVKEREQFIQQQLKAGDIKSQEISAAEAKAQVNQVAQLVQRMVGQLRIGEVGAKNFASLDLAASADVPTSFAGSNLTLSYQAGALTIHFDNFMTPQQENNAITLVEKHKEQLEQMMQALQAKNIQVAELLIGTHVVSLPQIQPLPPPFQAAPTSQAESQHREREGGEGDEGPGGGEKEPG